MNSQTRGVTALADWQAEGTPSSRGWCVETVQMVAAVYYRCQLRWVDGGKARIAQKMRETMEQAVEATILEYRYLTTGGTK